MVATLIRSAPKGLPTGCSAKARKCRSALCIGAQRVVARPVSLQLLFAVCLQFTEHIYDSFHRDGTRLKLALKSIRKLY